MDHAYQEKRHLLCYFPNWSKKKKMMRKPKLKPVFHKESHLNLNTLPFNFLIHQKGICGDDQVT